MNCLSLSELSDAQIDEMSADLRKRLALFRVTSALNQLPAVTPNPPSGVTPGAVAGGAYYMEKFA
jgi:hypothetical protein